MTKQRWCGRKWTWPAIVATLVTGVVVLSAQQGGAGPVGVPGYLTGVVLAGETVNIQLPRSCGVLLEVPMTFIMAEILGNTDDTVFTHLTHADTRISWVGQDTVARTGNAAEAVAGIVIARVDGHTFLETNGVVGEVRVRNTSATENVRWVLIY